MVAKSELTAIDYFAPPYGAQSIFCSSPRTAFADANLSSTPATKTCRWDRGPGLNSYGPTGPVMRLLASIPGPQRRGTGGTLIWV